MDSVPTQVYVHAPLNSLRSYSIAQYPAALSRCRRPELQWELQRSMVGTERTLVEGLQIDHLHVEARHPGDWLSGAHASLTPVERIVVAIGRAASSTELVR